MLLAMVTFLLCDRYSVSWLHRSNASHTRTRRLFTVLRYFLFAILERIPVFCFGIFEHTSCASRLIKLVYQSGLCYTGLCLCAKHL